MQMTDKLDLEHLRLIDENLQYRRLCAWAISQGRRISDVLEGKVLLNDEALRCETDIGVLDLPQSLVINLRRIGICSLFELVCQRKDELENDSQIGPNLKQIEKALGYLGLTFSR